MSIVNAFEIGGHEKQTFGFRTREDEKVYSKEKIKLLVQEHLILGRDDINFYEEVSQEFLFFLKELRSPVKIENDNMEVSLVKHVEKNIDHISFLYTNGCYYGGRDLVEFWDAPLKRLFTLGFENSSEQKKETSQIRLKLYPALLMFYLGGISALAGEKYHNLKALLDVFIRKDNINYEIARYVYPKKIMNEKLFNSISEKTIDISVNQYVFDFLYDKLKHLIHDKYSYNKYFDMFEYILSLVYLDIETGIDKNLDYFPVGLYHKRGNFGYSFISDIEYELRVEKRDCPLLKVGLFDSSFEHFQMLRGKLKTTLCRK